MITKIYLFLVLLLTGCATPEPQIVYRPVEVQIPVAVPCKVDAPVVPQWARAGVSPDADLYTKGRAIIAELQQRIAYEIELLAAVASCQ